ncbi:MAG: hypothetical protein LUI08_00430 [Prevotella sp.]|nr:hypothetical protein [Prevotella sp.]
MKKNIFNTKNLLLTMLLAAVILPAMTSCSDDEEKATGAPTITGVRVTDPEYADSLFTKAGAGSMIAILGNNLADALAVYVCDQEVFLNPTLNTNHSIIVTIPSEENGFVLPSLDSSLKSEIRVETALGTATYAFTVYGPSPSITRIDADYPRTAGNIVTVNGMNLVDIESAYITDIPYDEFVEMNITGEVPGNHTMITGIETVTADHHLSSTNYYETTSVLTFPVPENIPESGTLVFECAAGNAYIGFSVNPGVPVIKTVSNDMPQIGEDLIITGTELLQAQISYGDITLSEDEFTISETYDTICIPFQRKPSEGSDPTLTITTPGGTATVERFYDWSTILTTFDNDDATDNGWDPNASYADSGTDDGIYAYIDLPNTGQSWWGTMIYFRKDWNGNSFPLSDNIPADAPSTDVYFAYNVYDNSDFNNGTFPGYLRYMIQLDDGSSSDTKQYYYDNGFEWTDYDAQEFAFNPPVLADINGEYHKNMWYRVTVSLDNFDCYQGMTWSQIVDTQLWQFYLMYYNQGTAKGDVDVKIDNIRVIYIPSN